MLKKSEMQSILGHALSNKPYNFYGDYTRGFAGYWKAKDGCDLELKLRRTEQGITLNILLFERVTVWHIKTHKEDLRIPTNSALTVLRKWLPIECRGVHNQ